MNVRSAALAPFQLRSFQDQGSVTPSRCIASNMIASTLLRLPHRNPSCGPAGPARSMRLASSDISHGAPEVFTAACIAASRRSASCVVSAGPAGVCTTSFVGIDPRTHEPLIMSAIVQNAFSAAIARGKRAIYNSITKE